MEKPKLIDLLHTEVNGAIGNAVQSATGRLLTIVDASYPDPEQRKAIKDLITNHVIYGDYGLTDIMRKRLEWSLYKVHKTFSRTLPLNEFDEKKARERRYWFDRRMREDEEPNTPRPMHESWDDITSVEDYI